jgi:hypothetical protein
LSLGAELVVLNVVPRYPMSYFEGGASVADEEVGRIEQQWADSGQAIVDAAQKTAQAQGVKAKAVTMQSDLIAASIMAAAKTPVRPHRHGLPWAQRHQAYFAGQRDTASAHAQCHSGAGFTLIRSHQSCW